MTSTGVPAPTADRYESVLEESQTIHGVSLWQDGWRRLRKNRMAMASLSLIATVALAAVLTPALPLQSPMAQDLKGRQFRSPNLTPISLGLSSDLKTYRELRERLQSERIGADEKRRQEIDKHLAAAHPYNRLWNQPGPIVSRLIDLRVSVFGDWCVPSICGTDELGRDLLSRLFWGARVSLIVGVVATFVSLLIGVTYGATAGFLGGLIDDLMMRFVDVLYSVPFIFIVIFAITILSEEANKEWLQQFGIDRIVIFYVLIGAIYWLTMARVVRGQVISLKNEQFVDAARTVGASSPRIIFRHLVPNVMGIVIVYLTLTIPAVMLFEAFLSFLGLGVSPPDVSWGLLANEGLQVITPIKIYWWLVLFPGLALTLTLFSLNFLGDGLRDALDPRMKNR